MSKEADSNFPPSDQSAHEVSRLGVGTGKPLTTADMMALGFQRCENGWRYRATQGKLVKFELTLPIEVVQPRERKPSLTTRLKAMARAGLAGELKPDGTIANLKPKDAVGGAPARAEANGVEINPWDELP